MASCVLLLVFFHNTNINFGQIMEVKYRLYWKFSVFKLSMNFLWALLMSFSFYFLAHFSMAAKEIVNLTAVNSDRQ